MARLGLAGAADLGSITRAYGERLAQAQQQLSASRSSSDRQQSQLDIAELTAAYELLTAVRVDPAAPGDTAQRTALDNATVLRVADASGWLASPSMNAVSPSCGMVLAERLEIGALLGSGGMGDVYAAHDRLKDEDIAIKVLRGDLAWSTAAKERFLAEAKVSCSLSHPNIIRVHDVGSSGGHYYFSMERLEGQTLRQYMQTAQRAQRALRLDEVLGMVRQLVEALEYAHRYIVHRDLKPENIWLAEDGTVKLMDFGIARAYSHSQITKTGMTLGTAYYMAPEQQKAAQEVDWRADQYSLGVVLYEMLSGTVPMGAATPLGKLRRDLPRRAAQAVMRAMAPRPEDRWPSLDELSHALHATPGNAGRIAAALLLGVGALAAGKNVYDSSRPAAPTAHGSTDLGSSDPGSTDLGPTPQATTRPVVLPNIAASTVEVPLAAPAVPEIANSYEEAVAAASLRSASSAEREIIESEFIEPEFIGPKFIEPKFIEPGPIPAVTSQDVVQTAVRQPVREPARVEPPPVQPRFDPRRGRGELLPPPPPGAHPPPRHDVRHDTRRPPPPRR